MLAAVAMSETEKRLLAVELLLIELAPWLAEGALDAAAVAIRAGLVDGICTDEKEVRLQALQLLDEGQRRNLPFNAGMWITAANDRAR
jgi:hypothetical protein